MSSEDDADDGEKRRRTIPLFGEEFQWWTDAVRARLVETGMNQKQLASAVGDNEGIVSRCIRREKPVYELLIAISDALELPYPVVLATSYDEALRLAAARRLYRRDRNIQEIKAGVGESSTERQTPALTSVDGKPKKSARRPSRRRRLRQG